jgi:hypothetical protein
MVPSSLASAMETNVPSTLSITALLSVQQLDPIDGRHLSGVSLLLSLKSVADARRVFRKRA